MKNVEKSDIKVIEIQRKGTESTVVEVPKDLADYTAYIVPKLFLIILISLHVLEVQPVEMYLFLTL